MSLHWLNPATVPATPQSVFSEQSLAYCQALSEWLMTQTEIRQFPDLVALAFWLRPAQLQQMLKPYRELQTTLLPLGRMLHLAPANVDALFVYSGMLSFLCGNSNMIRLSNRSGPSQQWLIRALQAIAPLHPEANARFQLLRCDHQDADFQQLAATVDGRVLWGSDNTIQNVRQWPVKAQCRDLSFNHKSSLCLMAAKPLLALSDEELTAVVQLFARDHLTFGQQGCSSAKTLVWLGQADDITQAQLRFWPVLAQHALDKQLLSQSEQMLALTTAQQLAMTGDIQQLQLVAPLCCAGIHQLQPEHHQWHQGAGLFLQLAISELDQLTHQLQPYHQTLSFWGLDTASLQSWLAQVLQGLDRVVPLGQSLQFSPVWDGIDLIRQFSRQRPALATSSE